jgi:YD repeat-containing protein
MNYYNWNSSTYSFPGNGTLSVDHWGFYNGKNNNNSTGIPFLKLGYLTSNYDEVITSNYRNPDANYAKTGMLEKITYPTGGYSIFDYESNDYSTVFKRLSTNNFNHVSINETGSCGGLRIKSIYNYTALNQQSDYRLFEYLNGTNSSGILLHFPRYNVKYNAITSVSSGGLAEVNIDYYSSSIQSFNGTHIEYSKVTEKRSDNSKIEYTFSNSLTSEKYADVVEVSNIVNEPTIQYGVWNIDKSYICDVTAPVTSKQAERGRLLRKDIFKLNTDTNPLFSEINNYNTNKILAIDYLPVYLVRKFGYSKVNVDNYKLQSSSTIENQSGNNVTQEKKYSYNSKEQVIRVAISDSKGDSLITKYTYVTDLPSYQITSGSVYKAMLDSNVISYPLKEELYLKKPGYSEVLISGKKYTYINPVSSNKRIVKVSKVELYDKNNAAWYTDIEYTQFDSKGNILESRDKNGLFSCYVWGYNGLYLVAKVEGGLSLNNLKSAISGLSNISTSPLTGAMISGAQNTLKTSWPSVKMTVYEYIPFVGLSKIIDPSGKVTEYQYNASGKLKGIKDGNNQLHNEYFYSPDNKL